MKKFRKAMALLLGMVMVLSFMPQAVLGAEYTADYEDCFAGWGVWYIGAKNESTYFTCVTDEIAHDGKNSIVLKHTDSSVGDNLYVVQENLSAPAGTYTVSFWAAGTGTGQFVNLQGEEWLNHRLGAYTPVETDGIWSKYELEFTVPDGKTNNTLVFGAEAGTEGWYIDDISLVVKGTTENLLTNVSFEGEEKVPTATYTADYEDCFAGWGVWYIGAKNESTYFTCVTDEIAHDGSYSAVIRHTDSSVGDNLYVVQENFSAPAGTYTVSFWAAGTGAKQFVNLQGQEWLNKRLESCTPVETDGIWSKYELEFTVPDGKTNNALVFGAEVGTEGWYIDDISLVKAGTTENLLTNVSFEGEEKVPTATYTAAYESYFAGWGQWYIGAKNESAYFTCVTDEIAHDGSNSVVIRHTDSSVNDNLYVVQENFSAPAGTYTVSFWAAGTGTKQFVNLQGEEWLNKRLESYTPVETDGIWSKYELEFTVPEGKTNNTLVFGAEVGTEGWYIDDISLVAQGSSKNLLANASFEDTTIVTGPVIDIKSVNMGSYEGKAWDVTIDSFDGAKSYVAAFTDGDASKTGEIGFDNVEADDGSIAFAIFLHTQRAEVALNIVAE